jgi:hypothetical protein
MATKDKGKTPPAPEPEPQEPAKEPTGAPDPTPEPVPEPPVLPERFQGKKPEEIIKMYEEAEKEKDRLGTEVGKLRGETDDYRNNLAYYQNMAQDLQAKLEKGGVKPESQIPDVQFNYDNPLPSIQEVVQRELKKDREAREKTEKEREYQRASMNFATGRSKAMKDNPDLFRGIERQLEQGMWGYFQKGNVTSDELRDPETWENGARMIHLANKAYDRIVPPKVEPVSSTPTEVPSAAKPNLPEDEVPNIELDDFGKELIAHRPADMSEKDFMKLVQETKKREGR